MDFHTTKSFSNLEVGRIYAKKCIISTLLSPSQTNSVKSGEADSWTNFHTTKSFSNVQYAETVRDAEEDFHTTKSFSNY